MRIHATLSTPASPPADAELDKLCLHQLNAAARDFMAAGGGSTSLTALALVGLTAASAASPAAATAAASAASSGGGGGGGDAAAAEEAGAEAGGSGSPHGSANSLTSLLSPGPAAASGRSGFMHRAFARHPAGGGGGGPSGASAGAGAHHASDGASSAAAADAFAVFQQRVREFNACVPYAGLQPGEREQDGCHTSTSAAVFPCTCTAACPAVPGSCLPAACLVCYGAEDVPSALLSWEVPSLVLL